MSNREANSYKPVIKRYLSDEYFNRIKRDFEPVIDIVNKSYYEYNLQLRKNELDIYYQGNALAMIEPRPKQGYRIKIHKKFLEGIVDRISQSAAAKPVIVGEYYRFLVSDGRIRSIFSQSNMEKIATKIRKVGNGEEITFEQSVITDNPARPKFIIIDRQVRDHENPGQIDMIGLQRGDINQPFHFVIIEVKLGRNKELEREVANQIGHYINHVQTNITAYAYCYEKNYEQKRELGLFKSDMPDIIKIERNLTSVEGVVVVCGYSQRAYNAINRLKAILTGNPQNIKIAQMPRFDLLNEGNYQ